jgi:WD40 repeat protein
MGFSPCGELVLSGGYDNKVNIFDFKKEKCLKSFQVESAIISGFLDPNSRNSLVFGLGNGSIACSSLETLIPLEFN